MKASLLMIAIALSLSPALARQKVTLVGLDPAAVEKKIGLPDVKDELVDSDEAYWTYKTREGTLTVHFQNHVVVGIAPEDFPVDKIVK